MLTVITCTVCNGKKFDCSACKGWGVLRDFRIDYNKDPEVRSHLPPMSVLGYNFFPEDKKNQVKDFIRSRTNGPDRFAGEKL